MPFYMILHLTFPELLLALNLPSPNLLLLETLARGDVGLTKLP